MNSRDIRNIDTLLNARADQLQRDCNRCRREGQYMQAAGFQALMDGVYIAMSEINKYARATEKATKPCRDGNCVLNRSGHCNAQNYSECKRRLARKRK